MKTISKTKHYIQNSVAAIAASALLIIPGAVTFAHGGRGGHRGEGNKRNSSPQVQVRAEGSREHNQRFAFSAQRGNWSEDDDNRRGGSWWGDWRFNNDRNDDPSPNSCEARQARSNKQTDRLKKASQFMLGRLSWQVTSQQQYAAKHNVAPANFDALIATANTDKVSAQTAINALQAPTIDCTQPAENDASVLQANKQPVIEALRVYNIDAVNVSYAVQAAR